PVPTICFSLSSASPAHSPKEEYVITQLTDTPKEETVHDHPENQGEPQDDKSELTEKKSSWEEQLDAHQEQLEKEMQEARRMVFRLQVMHFRTNCCSGPRDISDRVAALFATNPQSKEQVVLIRSRLDQSMEEALDLKRELLRHKQETRHIQAIKDALQQRLAVQEDAVLQLKQELLRCNMAKDQLEGENAELKRKLSERNKLLSEYELGRKDRILQQQQQKLDEAQHKAHEAFRSEGSGYSNSVASTSPPVFQHSGEELQVVREALRSLRDSFSGHDPQHHTLDTLEQGVATLMDRLHSLDTQRRQDRGEFKSPGRRANSTDRDSWPPSSKMAHSHSSPGLDTAVSTKVLYFTDRSLTPFLINIPKRLGEVTLRDFKAAVDRQGSFRYHFKALDPEFGTVKEEVFQDGAVVPGWEGKIVAWVEEDHGERR
uniref:DIX domain containing 1a n=1 Tax=Neolamprologus brichardi TaxID=32507 RepID=A0A3Q4IAC5_NEOBR